MECRELDQGFNKENEIAWVAVKYNDLHLVGSSRGLYTIKSFIHEALQRNGPPVCGCY
jgi:hypothetical protein